MFEKKETEIECTTLLLHDTKLFENQLERKKKTFFETHLETKSLSFGNTIQKRKHTQTRPSQETLDFIPLTKQIEGLTGRRGDEEQDVCCVYLHKQLNRRKEPKKRHARKIEKNERSEPIHLCFLIQSDDQMFTINC